MILTRTPLRVSLAGGGTDLPAFYQSHGGCTISLAINKFVYIGINPKFDGKFRLSYSITELVDRIEEIQHNLARTCMEVFFPHGLEITSVADIPGSGTGLGSSSAFTVGLLAALSQSECKHIWSPKMLAEMAYLVEAKLCGNTLGKQDQYVAAYGGLHAFEYDRDGCVRVIPICLDKEQTEYLNSHLLLLWTGQTRQAEDILRQQNENLKNNERTIEHACQMRQIARGLRDHLETGDLDHIGDCLDHTWRLKKQLAHGISNDAIHEAWLGAMKVGAVGGKLCGAGGGGFLLFWADPSIHAKIAKETGLKRVPIKLEEKGSQVVYGGDCD